MTGGEVLLSIPAINVLSPSRAARLIIEREPAELVAGRQRFDGVLSGRALLIFPQSQAFDVARAVAGDEIDAADMAAMVDEALAETGNIILNACLGTMANMLQQPLTVALPELARGTGATFFGANQSIGPSIWSCFSM